MNILEWLFSVLFSLGILGSGMLLRRLSGTWATPGALFCGFWFLFSFIPLLALFYVPVNPLALGYLFLCCLVFSLPALSTNWHAAFRCNAANAADRVAYLSNPFIRAVFVTSLIASTLFILFDLWEQGISLTNMVFYFFETSNEYLEMRYEGELKVNSFGQWGLISAYLCVTFGSLVHARMRAKDRWRLLVLVMLMTPPILIMLAQAAKGLFFLSIAILLGAHLIRRVLTDKRPHIDFGALASSSRYLILAAPLILISFLARGLYNIDDADVLLSKLLGYLNAYAFLHIYAFSDWFSFTIDQPSLQSYTSEPLAFGNYTFLAVFKILDGALHLPPGIYTEYLAIEGLSPGNIYTIFRGLITDFGLGGSLLVLYLWGAVFNLAYRQMLMSRYPAISLAIYFLFVHVLYTSYIISALIWNTTYLVTVLVALLFIANRQYVTNRAKRFSQGTSDAYIQCTQGFATRNTDIE